MFSRAKAPFASHTVWIAWQLEDAPAACSDPKDARIRGWDGPYQYASEPISIVESDRLSNASTKW